MRRLAAIILCGALLGTLAIATAASAQDPCQLTLSEDDGNPGTSNFTVDESRTFTFTVTNPGNTEVEGTVVTLQDPPPGWDWSTQPQTVRVPGDSSQDISIRVVFLGERSLDAELGVQVQDVHCTALVGGGINGPNSDPVTFSMTHAPLPAGPGADEGLPWAWIVFGVIVAGAVVGVPLVYSQRGAKIDASVEEPEKDVVAGRGTSFPVTLKNQGKDPVPVRLEVSEVQEGWSALTTLPDLEMGPKETRTVYMMVRAPPDAKPGDLCVAKLQVKPDGGSATEVKTLSRVDKVASEAADEEPPAEDADAEEES